MKQSVVQCENLSKQYGDTKAIEDISFQVNEGEIFGLIGPDGAGKTTIFRILTSLIIPDAGTAAMHKCDVVKDYKKIRQMVGYMPGRFSLYQDLSVQENLHFFATVFGTTIRANYHLVKDIYSHIEPFKKRKAGKLSGGMKQKLALSCALIHKPDVLILDEPTTGVDAVSRKEFWEMLQKLKEKNITILVATPYMDEATLCDRVALIQNGRIMQIATPQNIINQFEKKLYEVRSDSIYKLMDDLQNYEFTNSAFLFGQYLHYTDKREELYESDLHEYLTQKQHHNIEINSITPNIEDCFMALMQQ